MPIITLLTDFGVEDTFVGQLRGVIAGIAPEATVIDLTHAIPPQDVLRGAIAWVDSVAAFPPGTIHMGVVDPGVGTARHAIAAQIGPWGFVAPDNGLLTAVRQRWPTQTVVKLTRTEWHRTPSSHTFHGRDVFAPAAAHWASGVSLAELGTPLASPLTEVDIPKLTRSAQGVYGQVLWPDRFGNLITNITRADVPDHVPPQRCVVTVGDQCIQGLSRCYGECQAGSLLALWGSSERLELAIREGSAVAAWGGNDSLPVSIQW